MARFVLAAAVALMSACASIGHAFDERRLVDLQPGVTTMAQAEAVLGGPANQLVRTPDRKTILIWQRIVAAPGVVTENKMASVVFGPDGRMVRIQHLADIAMPEPDQLRLGVVSVADSRIRRHP